MLTKIRDHFDTARRDFAHIQREQLLFQADKIVPIPIFDESLHAKDGKNTPLHLLFKYFYVRASQIYERKIQSGACEILVAEPYVLPNAYLALMESVLDKRIARLELMSREARFYQHNFRLLAERNQVIKSNLAAHLVNVICRPMGDMIADYEEVLRDPDFARAIRISALAGKGAPVLELWRDLNALPDWKPYARPVMNDSGRKRRQLPRETSAAGWQPAFI